MTHYGYQQAPGFPPHQSYLPQPNYYGPQITTGQAPPTSAVLYPNAAYHPQPSMAPGGNQQALTLPGCPAQQVYSPQPGFPPSQGYPAQPNHCGPQITPNGGKCTKSS